MEKIKLNEAFAYAKANGNKTKKIDLAKILWSDSSAKTAHANFSNLCSGKTKKIDIEAVPVICEKLGVTADYLFGISKEPTREKELSELRAKILEYLDKWDEDKMDITDFLN